MLSYKRCEKATTVPCHIAVALFSSAPTASGSAAAEAQVAMSRYTSAQDEAEEKAQCTRKMLTITVISAQDLVEKDSGLFGDHSDPYCVVIVADDADDAPVFTESHASAAEKLQDKYCNDDFAKKTQIVMDDLNPVWNEDFQFTVPDDFPKPLQFKVYDRDVGVADLDDFMGKAQVSLADMLHCEELAFPPIELSTQGTLKIVVRKVGEAAAPPSAHPSAHPASAASAASAAAAASAPAAAAA